MRRGYPGGRGGGKREQGVVSHSKQAHATVIDHYHINLLHLHYAGTARHNAGLFSPPYNRQATFHTA